MRLGVSPTAASTPQVFSVRGLRLYFPELEPWVAQSVSLPSWSSRFICKRMWGHPVRQPPPSRESSEPGCPPPPLLPFWVSVSSLTPWLLDFHTVPFSVSSACFLFLNLFLSFWLFKEARCVYLCLPLGQKSAQNVSYFILT